MKAAPWGGTIMQQFLRRYAILYCAVFSMSSPVLVHAAAVYKWVDAEGVTWFSEEPPATELASIEVSRVAIDDYTPKVTGDLQSVLDVANSIEASRLERERARGEKERLMLKRRQLQQQSANAEQQYNTSYGVWYAPPYYRPPARPHPPYARPPVHTPRPGGTPPGRVTLGR